MESFGIYVLENANGFLNSVSGSRRADIIFLNDLVFTAVCVPIPTGYGNCSILNKSAFSDNLNIFEWWEVLRRVLVSKFLE